MLFRSRDEGTLYAAVLSHAPEDASGYEGLARHSERIGNLPAAVAAYEGGLAAVTDEQDRLSLIEGLALLHARHGQHERSIEAYRRMANSGHAAQAYVGMANNHCTVVEPLWPSIDTSGDGETERVHHPPA